MAGLLPLVSQNANAIGQAKWQLEWEIRRPVRAKGGECGADIAVTGGATRERESRLCDCSALQDIGYHGPGFTTRSIEAESLRDSGDFFPVNYIGRSCLPGVQ